MGRNVAIVAHFDANDLLEKNFRDVLSCLEHVCDRVILVTTSDIDLKSTTDFSNLTVIKRPNIGYDFYSYRVGLQNAFCDTDIENVILINSSFVLLEPQRFTNALKRMIALSTGSDVVGANSSLQVRWHLQSYLLLIGRNVLNAGWFREFVTGIEPLNTKLETILQYEIGLSAAFLAHGVNSTVLFEPTRQQVRRARRQWSAWLIRRSGIRQWLESGPLHVMKQFNPAHFLADEIARQLGYVKTEVLRDNQYNVDTDFLRKVASAERLHEIEDLVARVKAHYRIGRDNLTALSTGGNFLSQARWAHWGRSRIKGVDVAVVLHLYYVDLIDEIGGYLRNIVSPFDLFVTTPFEGAVPRIINQFSSLARSVSVSVTENRGRDIGPFIALYRSGALDGYSAVLKLHSKKSLYSDSGSAWRAGLYRSVIGDSLTVQRALELLASGEVGIVGPHAYYLTNQNFWGANKQAMGRLLGAAGMLGENEEPDLGFFAGSMFWFSPPALRPLQTIPEEELDFELENGVLDGTLAHAMERLFCPIARKAGYRTTSVKLNGREIHHTQTLGNRVPVL
jgi:lipopolysaccharide biosynthesis protein